MTVENFQWPSWTWCRTWWNHSWYSSRVTLNQRCFAFIRPHTPLVYRYHFANSEPQRCFWLLPIGVNGAEPTARRCLTVEQLLYRSDWIWTGRAAQIYAKQSLYSGIQSQNNEHCRGSYSTPVLTQCTKTITRLVSNKKYCIWIKCLNVWHIFKRVLA